MDWWVEAVADFDKRADKVGTKEDDRNLKIEKVRL
jgi:hypothetical protein